ncbi:hypothetical protein [Sphaerisporangium corydalis]|uniref:Uncharacterized protein n=1 Tax=Sphaerisporangium corydalis TaxID=1441875 RepID=A0ABV9EI32_9ACTN|nr:hypothetical protein [Sphaerisporangium corydalis]
MSDNIKSIAARITILTVIGLGGVAVAGTMASAESGPADQASTSTVTPSPTPTPTPPLPDSNTPWG